jgi:hypothetical protein
LLFVHNSIGKALPRAKTRCARSVLGQTTRAFAGDARPRHALGAKRGGLIRGGRPPLPFFDAAQPQERTSGVHVLKTASERTGPMNSIIYLVGLVVVVIFIVNMVT